MTYKVVASVEAQQDVAAISEYISEKFHSPNAALSFLDSYIQALEYLTKTPEMFSVSQNTVLAAKGVRCFAIGNYVGVYKVDSEVHEVQIVRVFYGPSDYTKYV